MDREGFDQDRVKEIKGRLDAKKPGDSLDEEMRMIHSMAEGKTGHTVGEFEDSPPNKALEGVLFGNNRVIGAYPTTQENALAKAGTSEGAKLGWETRQHGGAKEEPTDWKKVSEYHEREIANISRKMGDAIPLTPRTLEEKKLRVEALLHLAGKHAAGKGRKVTEDDIKSFLVTQGDKITYANYFAPNRPPVEKPKEPTQGKPEPPKKPEEKKEPPKAEEKPKEPGKQKPLTTWDVKNEGNSIASKLREIKVKRQDGSGVGNIKVTSVVEEEDGILIEMYAEGLKVGGPDDDDSNDSQAEDALFNEGKKIVQEKFPNHDVGVVGSEKGYFGFLLSQKGKKEPLGKTLERVRESMLKAGTSEGAKRGWEARRGGATQVISQPTESEQASRLQGTPAKFVGGPPAPKKMMETFAGEAQDETHGYFGPGTGRNAALDADVGETLQAMGVKPKEAKEFLYSSMGRHLADSISTLKPGEGKEEIRQRAEAHLKSYRKWAGGTPPKPMRLPIDPFKLPLRSVSETRKTNPIGPFVLGLDKKEFEEDEHQRDASGKFAPAGEASSGKPAGEEKPKEPKPEKPLSSAKMNDYLSDKGVHADKVSGKDGKYKAYFGFFYRRSGESSQEKADKIQAALPEAKIIHHEEHSAPFRGGSPVERQQHWMVEFEYTPKKPEEKKA
jgi:hypothetical protein